ncbi:Elongator complex protein 6 isoform X2 [Oopsacas minuta]|uniref:Elongator complex protein 6 n=1 Tax=Oopsacas minuta TaxID=111878 RepID=A0AAV7JSK6_9METZ|nr:Elongator complex protein 6 isoform X2 [Oopsacas minuta]
MSISRTIEELYSSLLFQDKGYITSNKLVLLESPYCFSIDAGFLIHHLTAFYLKSNHKVVLVSFLNCFQHYNTIGLKLGINLASSRIEGNLTFIDCISQNKEDSTVCPLTNEANECSLSNISNCLQKLINKHQDSHHNIPLTILIDDLSSTVLLGISQIQVLDLIFSVRALLQAKLSIESSLCVLATSNGDFESTEGRLVNHLSNESDIILTVEGLPSGFSKEVHGKLIARSKRPSPVIVCYREDWHFKLEDRGVKLFPIGTASGIL